MLEIINAICAQRLQKIETAFESDNHGVSSTIHLSPELATAFAKQVNKHTDKDLFFKTADFKMQYVFMGSPWTIVSADRDAFLYPNDPDVEAEILDAVKRLRSYESPAPKTKVLECPQCKNPYPHILTDGSISCEECGYAG